MSEVTRILHSIQTGEPKAAEDLLPLVYEELRRLAARKMANEAPGQTLQPTALVHEALEALAQEDPQKAEIVKLRFFVGLGHDEIAALLGVNEKTVRRHWEVAKVRLFQAISSAK